MARFHAHLNASEYEQIYLEANDAFRQSGTKDDMIKLFSAIHKKLGEAKTVGSPSLNVNATPTGTFITTQYNTTFERGPATETFTWVKEGNSVKLYDYNINSTALITN